MLFKLTNPIHFLALGFGSGLIKPAPGTWGTLAALPLYFLLSSLSFRVYILVILVMAIAGIWICRKAAEDAGVHDHPSIVWDEIVGFLITMTAVPFEYLNVLAGFLLFRFFDIVKPWPISFVDKSVHGGTGIMADDILAGVFACLALHSLLMFF